MGAPPLQRLAESRYPYTIFLQTLYMGYSLILSYFLYN